MKQKRVFSCKGFTLTEVLLAVMIVGLIGVALASLSRGAARESGLGRSRVMLRNNMSLFMRQVRQDLDKATEVTAAGAVTANNTTTSVELLRLKHGGVSFNTSKWSGGNTSAIVSHTMPTRWVTYCFTRGGVAAYPKDHAYDGGSICRLENEEFKSCGSANCQVLLNNVKYIDNGVSISGRTYPVPLFQKTTYSPNLGSAVNVHLITELKGDGDRVVNEVMEETFMVPSGY